MLLAQATSGVTIAVFSSAAPLLYLAQTLPLNVNQTLFHRWFEKYCLRVLVCCVNEFAAIIATECLPYATALREIGVGKFNIEGTLFIGDSTNIATFRTGATP